MQKTLSWIALVGGEIVIFAAFRLWGGGLLPEIRTLNTVVSMIVLALFFVDILLPWVDWSDRSGKRLGALGLRWVATGLYALGAIAVMLLCNVPFDTPFPSQLLIHGILLLGLVLGFSAVVGASAKVGSVHAREEQLRSGLDDLKRRARQLQRAAGEIPDLPAAGSTPWRVSSASWRPDARRRPQHSKRSSARRSRTSNSHSRPTP